MKRTLLTILLLACLPSCASIRPLTTVEAGEVDSSQLEFSVLEGRPGALLLFARAPHAQPGDVLLLRRQLDDRSVDLVSVPLDGKLLETIQGDGINLSDDTMESGNRYRYVVLLGRDERLVEQANLEVTWGDEPLRPETVRVIQLVDGVAEVGWEPGGPAAIFVRNVLDESAALQRTDVPSVAGATHIFTGLAPDGVYAFRVAPARDEGNYIRYGTPSEEVYLTLVPQDGPEPPSDTSNAD